ncbi:MAG: hypothetical protein JWQ35_2506 [Bacteriovoracaceae bacterium]|nr:hypothetical protein [Bacteriovoracaceae bacterium]
MKQLSILILLILVVSEAAFAEQAVNMGTFYSGSSMTCFNAPSKEVRKIISWRATGLRLSGLQKSKSGDPLPNFSNKNISSLPSSLLTEGLYTFERKNGRINFELVEEKDMSAKQKGTLKKMKTALNNKSPDQKAGSFFVTSLDDKMTKGYVLVAPDQNNPQIERNYFFEESTFKRTDL